jgi:hypothetical protein
LIGNICYPFRIFYTFILWVLGIRKLALILVAWLWAVASAHAHQSDAKHCEDAVDTERLGESLAENLTKSNS